MQLQSLFIPLAAVATFAGVYVLAPGGQPAAPAVSVAQTTAHPAAAAVKPGNPLAPAEKGLVECSRPDDARKTCQALATYSALGGSRYAVTAVMLVSETGPVTLETNNVVEVKSGLVCGRMTRRHLAAGRLRLAGRTLQNDLAVRIRVAMQRSLAGVMDKEICSSYLATGTELTEVGTINGLHLPSLRQRVKWIRLDDGYTVGTERGS